MAKHNLKKLPKVNAKKKRNPSMVFGRNPRLVSKSPVPKKKPRRGKK